MATLNIDIKKIKTNITIISNYLSKLNIEWTLVVKVLSGNKEVLKHILTEDNLSRVHSIGDSRISGLKLIKSINPKISTMYIKPPPLNYIKSVVRYADISLNTSGETILALNEEAKKQNKIHKIIIMVELGELREGILGENVLEFYSNIFNLSNIRVIGLGTNLGCMYGVEPTFDKLIQLTLYEKLIEAKFSKNIEIVSGGSSITLPLISKKKLPKEINHFRIGEAVFMGKSPLNNKRFLNLNENIFTFCPLIIEHEKKDVIPEGNLLSETVGNTKKINNSKNLKINKAILDFGKLDVNPHDMVPINKNIKFVGTTSDMTVYEIGKIKNSYKTGESLKFKLNYMGVARLMASKFIDKKVIL